MPLALYPQGFDTNNLIIFQPSESQILAQNQSLLGTESEDDNISPDFSGASSQSTVAPTRPPTAPMKNSVGTIGVAYYDFSSQKTYADPLNGLGLPGNSGKVQIENSYGNLLFTDIPECQNSANNFVAKMISKAWTVGFNFSGGLFRINNLRSASLGGTEMFGNVNLGLFMDHGSYGTSPDYHSDASESLETYFASDNSADASAPWIRMSEFGFGGSLRWVAVLACNCLIDQNYDSMSDAGVLPIPSNLHLLCGTTTISYMTDMIGGIWAQKMVGGVFKSPETIENAWFDAGHDAYQYATNITNTVKFRVAGSDNCFSDTLKNYAGSTSGNITSDEQQVYP